ncbi:MAG: DsbE family thiol:disulfide interchange protein [Candidatus Parabeggiatoa sp. nov. 2]|nr:MAG: thiol:disulfide interchange protein [Beggiatoa sp. 4572_84]RKZ57105.1 MAG: DsbE family thiol:disulfide interchange protein [Gammaproteobacteria bacterium]
MLRYLLPLGLFIVLAGFLYVGLGLNPREIDSTRIDKPAPAFTLPQLSDVSNTLSDKDFIGKVSLLNVWSSSCIACRDEHQLLMQLAGEGYVIYGLVYKDTVPEAKMVLARTGNPYVANAFDEKGQIGMDWGVTGTPESFVIDKQGIVRYKHVGPLTKTDWVQIFQPLIEKLKKS